MGKLTVATTQMRCGTDPRDNLERAENLVREAAAAGAQLVLVQELFETPYFCIEQDPRFFDLAAPLGDSAAVARFRELAAELQVVLPCSWFERANRATFNSLAMIDAGGEILGVYRKSHIPNGPGYQEKQYFNPGDTGFRVWDTRHGRIGAGICWDQWFPEAARCMALLGAEVLLYPTAIGSEPPPAPPVDSSAHWRRAMQGHAAANIMPVVAANRVGREYSQDRSIHIDFYGQSFIADHTGAVVAGADAHSECVLIHAFDLDAIRRYRESWGIFRDRRPDLYGAIATLDGAGGR